MYLALTTLLISCTSLFPYLSMLLLHTLFHVFFYIFTPYLVPYPALWLAMAYIYVTSHFVPTCFATFLTTYPVADLFPRLPWSYFTSCSIIFAVKKRFSLIHFIQGCPFATTKVSQTSAAANLVHASMLYRKKLEKERIKPVSVAIWCCWHSEMTNHFACRDVKQFPWADFLICFDLECHWLIWIFI